MKVEAVFGIQPDVPTANGRTYPRHVLEKALESGVKRRNVYVVPDINSVLSIVADGHPVIPLHKAAGFLSGYQISEYDILSVELEIFPQAKGLLDIKDLRPIPIGYGTVEDNVVQDDFLLQGISFEPATEDRGNQVRGKGNK